MGELAFGELHPSHLLPNTPHLKEITINIMSKLSMLDEKITAKDEDYYLMKCERANREKSERINGYTHDWHNVEDKKVEVIGYWTQNGEDDVAYELDEVIIHDNKPF